MFEWLLFSREMVKRGKQVSQGWYIVQPLLYDADVYIKRPYGVMTHQSGARYARSA